MRVRVTPHARRREDRSGDPLDGLVNLFDLGIVLALAFLLVALSSLDRRAERRDRLPPDSVVVRPGERERTLPRRSGRVVGRGERVGTVYRLRDGRLVYVAPRRGAPARRP